MKKYKNIIIILFFLKQLSAQKNTQQFTLDTLKFMAELREYFITNSANKELATEYMDKMEKDWKKNIITGYYKHEIIKYSNKFLKKRLKPYPFFVHYFNMIYTILKNNKSIESYESWQKCADKILAGNSSRGIQDFFEMSEYIFERNILYKTPSYIFYLKNDDYKFEFDSVPKITFQKNVLVGMNPRGDSIYVEDVSGVYYPTLGKFYCKGGMVQWSRVGLPSDVNARLKKFEIDCKTGAYTSDSALFTGKQYFDKPQYGKLTDRIITENNEPTYPRFDSYSKRLLVKNIYPDVDFDGGFGMRGPKFVGYGNPENPAKIIIKRNNQKFLEVSARSFAMNSERISTGSGRIKFILEKDSITHPGLSFIYEVEKRKVTMIRTDDGLQKTPFYNSFHKLNMFFEQLSWKTDEQKMEFGFLPNNFQGEAFFESEDFFTKARYDELKGGDNISIIQKINEYYLKTKDSVFTAVDLAKYMKVMAVDLRPMLFKISIHGLIDYNPETDFLYIRKKLKDYILNNQNKRDYDIITIHSVNPGKPNAELNLLQNNFDLKIYGVKQILLSDTQKVFVFPKNQQITMKKNRNFEFSGVAASGKMEFHGKDFVFDYENFKIKMKIIDSIRIFVVSREPDINGNYFYRRVRTVIENANGELRIDGPTNKSGWKRAPTFPQFESFKESYAYYDKRSTFKGVYDRNRFYFKLKPFKLDSLDNFRNESLIFDGVFNSAGIFPVFEEKLTLQQDYSLGFIRQTPPGGFNVYGGKGKYDATISLSDKGLRGNGFLTFGPSKTKSDDFMFFPDSTNAKAQTFDIQEQDSPYEFPVTHGDTVNIHFMPYGDLLQASTIKKPMKMYKEQTVFRGRLDLSPKQLTGKGKVDFEKADLSANKILFIRRKFFSDTADFHLKAFDEEGFTFSTKNVNSKIDFDKREGEFITNGRGSYVKFDKNQYIAYMDRFTWYMDSEDIQLGDEKKTLDENVQSSLDLEGPEFISIHPKQDSLRFFAPAAKYNLRKYIINCKNVPFIEVADARIFPHMGKVTIYKNAVMDTLKEANMLANIVTRYHNIRNVTANIFGRRAYLARGTYNYIDENDRPQKIFFHTIKPDTGGQTIAEGKIDEKDKFRFNDYFSFAGKVRLEASNQFLFFNGGTQIVHGCKKVRKAYLKFEGEINPKDILIPIPEKAFDMNGNPVVNAIMYSLDTTAVYSGFVSPKEARSDKELVNAYGFLTYEPEEKEYRISSKEKLTEQNMPGNFLSLNVDDCKVYGEGKINLGADLGQLEIKTAGMSTHFPNDSVSVDLMGTIQFFFSEKALKIMIKDLNIFQNTATPIDLSSPLLTKGLGEITGKDKADKIISELNLYGEIKRYPDELEKTFVLTDLNFTYDARKKSFITGDMIGVVSIMKNDILRKYRGKIKIEKTRNKKDRFYFYLEPDPTTWYFFEYANGTMKAISSNREFNEVIKELKAKNRKQDVDKGPSFQFTIGSEASKNKFVRENMDEKREEKKEEEE
ncbi:MAG: hypothetical protein N3F09_07715 [Bacteroidia bacterium]|nr:hypothetical protein [Bacteroidia bacterium]